MDKINFIDLPAQQKKIRANLEKALCKVLDHGQYVSGPEVRELEHNLSLFCGAKHVLTCANGTDALSLVLLAKNIKPGDAVFVPSFTFASTAEVVAAMGATPIFVDINKDDFNMSAVSLSEAIAVSKQHGLNPTAVIAVDLFGLPANYSALSKVANQHDLWILADAAQSFGATLDGANVGNMGYFTTTSFFPAKPFGCYGDGGAIFTNDDDMAEVLASLKSHGQGKDRNTYVRIGTNSRLDSFQAAVLLEKLKLFPDELKHRQSVASAYNEFLADSIITPKLKANQTSAWAQYTVILPESVDRDRLAVQLAHKNIPTAIYYKTPLHQQPAYLTYAEKSPKLVNTEYLSKHVISLPMDGYIDLEKIKFISDSINQFIDE